MVCQTESPLEVGLKHTDELIMAYPSASSFKADFYHFKLTSTCKSSKRFMKTVLFKHLHNCQHNRNILAEVIYLWRIPVLQQKSNNHLLLYIFELVNTNQIWCKYYRITNKHLKIFENLNCFKMITNQFHLAEFILANGSSVLPNCGYS